MPQTKINDDDLIHALQLHDNNASKAAEYLGVTRSTIIKRRNKLPKSAMILDVEEFRIKRSDIFADLQRKVLQSITPQKLKKCSAPQLATVMAILFDKERLEQNLSTSNIAHKVGDNLSEEDKAEFRKLMKDRTEKLRKAIVYDD